MILPNPDRPVAPLAEGDLPAKLLDRLDGRRAVAHARFDLDADLRFADRHALLVEADPDHAALLYTDGEASHEVPLTEVTEAKADEATGVDRLLLRLADGRQIALPYSRRQPVRVGMTRLLHRLKKRLEHDTDPDLSPPPDADEVDYDTEQARPKVLLRLLRTAHPYRWHIRTALALTLLAGVLTVIPSYITKFIIDEAIDPRLTAGLANDERVRRLLGWGGLYMLAILGLMAVFWGRMRLLSTVGTNISRDLRSQVYAHLQGLSMRFFGKHRVGSLITRVTSDTDRLWDFIVFGSVDFIRNMLMMVVAAGLMFHTNWRLALIGLIPVPLIGLLTWYKNKKMLRMFGSLWTHWSRLTAIVGDALPGIKVVKAFAAEGREQAKFKDRNDDFGQRELNAMNVWVNLQPTVEGTMWASRIFILVAGGWLIIQSPDQPGNTLGTLIFFLTAVGFFHMAINEIVQKQRVVTRAATSAQRVYEVLDTPAEIESRPDALAPDKIDGRVEFRDVSFSYDGTKPVLRHIDLVAEPGEMIGLCGHSGAGKSTFVNLVSRFFDVSDGRILIDGTDVRDYDLTWLRSRVGVVLQEPYLFFGTIADNIRYGRPDASLAEVVDAARAANAHDFVSQLPDGYDTIVGERGQSLSGGERQRVSIARAILENPQILILDEATSSVDTKTEKAIQEALDRLVSGRTTFAIAHRLSTLAAADKIVVLDKGRIVEQGTHRDLLHKDAGHYRGLVEMQNKLHANRFDEE
jgi:ATP-binding cassette subfamily B protein